MAASLRELLIATDIVDRGASLLKQTGGRAVADFPVTRPVELQFPGEIVLTPSRIGVFHVAQMRAERRPCQTVDDVPGVSFAGGVRLEAFRMTQGPLELPLLPVLRLDQRVREGKQERWV